MNLTKDRDWQVCIHRAQIFSMAMEAYTSLAKRLKAVMIINRLIPVKFPQQENILVFIIPCVKAAWGFINFSAHETAAWQKVCRNKK